MRPRSGPTGGGGKSRARGTKRAAVPKGCVAQLDVRADADFSHRNARGAIQGRRSSNSALAETKSHCRPTTSRLQ